MHGVPRTSEKNPARMKTGSALRQLLPGESLHNRWGAVQWAACEGGRAMRRRTQSSEAYDVVDEREPGNPLFPTNFARLALGPTLTAKNPALHSREHPPPLAFPDPHAIRMGILRGRRGKPSGARIR